MKECRACGTVWIEQDDGSWKLWRGIGHKQREGWILAIPYGHVSKTVQRLLYPTAGK